MSEFPNALVYKEFITGGQPSAEQYKALSEAGYKHVIDLRPASETGAAENDALAGAAGMSYVRVPVAGSAGLTRENVERFAEVLTPGSVVHCKSGNRVGAIFALMAAWVDGCSVAVSYTHLTLPTTLNSCRSRWSPYH